MKIFVTGGAGFIGSNFIRHVLSLGKGHHVVNYDKLTYAGNLANLDGFSERPDYTFIKGDICDPSAVQSAMQGCDAVVHFAAESHVDRSIYEPASSLTTKTNIPRFNRAAPTPHPRRAPTFWFVPTCERTDSRRSSHVLRIITVHTSSPKNFFR
jgi:dTDP-glucose 4,6-dehydratase